MAWTAPVASDFKSRFDRDFVYGDGLDSVRDKDINTALAGSVPRFNQNLWSSNDETTEAYLLLTAHILVMNLQAAGGPSARVLGKGVQSVGGGVIQSKSVGSVTVTYSIPESVQNSPVLSPYMRTEYGQRYLEMLAPRLVGNVSVVGGPVDSDVASGDASQV